KTNGVYGLGATIDINVLFSEAVTVTGTPVLKLETGTTDHNAAYLTGSGNSNNQLTFRYTVQAGDTSLDLDYNATTAIELVGGATIQDTATNDATLTLAAPGDTNSLAAKKALKVDTTAPTVTNVTTATANGRHFVGEVIDVNVTFSETVTVTGFPTLALDTNTNGNLDRLVTYYAGSANADKNQLTFRYTIQANSASTDLDYNGTGALDLNGGTVKDTLTSNGNNATLTLAAPGDANSLGSNKSLIINPPMDVNSSTANGTYRRGSIIDINVMFAETVYVVTTGGTPVLKLETGTTDHNASYYAGSGNTDKNQLTFRYTVVAGDTTSDLDYNAITAIELAGGTIKNAGGNAVPLTLATPSDANSLAAKKALVIDTTAPVITYSVSFSYNPVTLSINTNETATCKYSTTAIDYNSNTGSPTSAGTSHSFVIANQIAGTSYTFYVQCIDPAVYSTNPSSETAYLLNDTNATITFTTYAPGSANPTGGTGGASWTAGTPSTTPATTTTLTNTTEAFTPTASELTTLEANDGTPLYTPEEVATIITDSSNYSFERTVKVEEHTSTTGVKSYTSTFTISVQNNSGSNKKQVLVVESIPKAVAADASQITSATQFRVLASDPIVEFTVPLLSNGQTANVTYTVNSSTKPDANRFTFASHQK
ncbi:MAG: hypothetical protein NTY48_02020, partial [Candidatus Diapherotrites archaeon]|nr:hypothetical protein [Candidatus Diapherotrites archaeon]